jgi:hypothetical protein
VDAGTDVVALTIQFHIAAAGAIVLDGPTRRAGGLVANELGMFGLVGFTSTCRRLGMMTRSISSMWGVDALWMIAKRAISCGKA